MSEIRVTAESMEKALIHFGVNPKVIESMRRTKADVVTDRCVYTLTMVDRYGITPEQVEGIFELALKNDLEIDV
jgi:hypothetical protein